MNKNHIHDYDDIIDLPYHKSKKHQPMLQADRAAQFAPFAALTGHKETLLETERLTERRRIRDEHQLDLFDQKIKDIMHIIDHKPLIEVCYFVSDDKKTGGKYVTLMCHLEKIDEFHRVLIMIDGTKIAVDDIYDLEICDET